MKKIFLLVGMAILFACNENREQQEKKKEIKDSMQQAAEDVKSAANNTEDYLTAQKQQAEDAIRERIKEIDQTTRELKKPGIRRVRKHDKNWRH